MVDRNRRPLLWTLFALIALTISFQGSALAQAPVVYTVPFQASNPTVPHTSWSGNPVILKGTMTSTFPGHTFTYLWTAGDGGTCAGTVTNVFDVECAHTYTGTPGTLFHA